MNFIFDEWAELARKDKQAFEKKRMELISQLIKNSDPDVRHKLQCLQFKINMEREKSKSAMGSCIRMQRMLMNHFVDKFIPTIENSRKLLINDNFRKIENNHTATIIPFPNNSLKN